jgi:hypothetical protein
VPNYGFGRAGTGEMNDVGLEQCRTSPQPLHEPLMTAGDVADLLRVKRSSGYE